MRLSAVQDFDSGRFEEALQKLQQAPAARQPDRALRVADEAILTLANGRISSAERLLAESRKQLEFLQQMDAREQATSLLTDDHAVAWTGREFERRTLDCLTLLSSLLGSRQDALAYSWQIAQLVEGDRQQLQSASRASSPQVRLTSHEPGAVSPQSPGKRLSANAFAEYLIAAVHSESPLRGQLADKALQQIAFWRSGAAAGGIENSRENQVVNAAFGVQTAPKSGTLHVVTLVGRVTDWEAETAEPTSTALLLADQLLSAVGDHTLPPTIAPVRIARPVRRSSTAAGRTSAFVTNDDGLRLPATQSSVLVDLNAAAWDSYLHDRDHQIARAVARRIMKKGAVYAAKNQLSVNSDTGLDIVMNVGGVIWEAVEKPDTRHLAFLPERIETLQQELPVGTYALHVSAGHQDTPRASETCRVHVDDGRNTFVLCVRSGGVLRVVCTDAAAPAALSPPEPAGR